MIPLRLTRFLVLLLFPCWVSAQEVAPAAKSPLVLGSQLQLLLDREIIASMQETELRMHPPVLQPKPKSTFSGHYVTILKDGARFRAYYRGSDPSYKGERLSGHPGEITCYAESRDGHEWSFPKLGLFEVNGTRENNVILAHQSPLSTNFSPFIDTRPGVPASQRYKALAGHPGYDRQAKADGLFALISADGIHWNKLQESNVIPYDRSWSHAFDSQNVSFWSETEGLYVCYFRTWASPESASAATPQAASSDGKEAGHKGSLRSISRATSPDFIHWSAPVAMNPNFAGEHLYTNQTTPYFRASNLYIALPTRYTAGRVGSEKAIAMLGSTDIMLMTTKAGSTQYDRVFNEAFLRPGLDPQRWGNRANYLALNIHPTGPAEMSLWHGLSGDRYTLRTDGFASVHAGRRPGAFTTQAFTFTGNQLMLNVSTAAAGSVRVEVQDAEGVPVPGFTLADSLPVVGDRIEHAVQWQGMPSLSPLQGKPIQLRLVMQEADVYAFQFQTSALKEVK